jgi:putative glutamine amidotransferase
MTESVAAVSQRGLRRAPVDEPGDWLDDRWYPLLRQCGMVALPLPNHLDTARALWRATQPAALVLSGGNDLSHLPDARDVWLPRDAVENWALDTAEHSGIPVVGICRGAQLLAHRAGAPLVRDSLHAGTRHSVLATSTAGFGWPDQFTVASHHNWTIPAGTLPALFDVLAIATDGTAEAFQHRQQPHFGLMWHPERESDPAGPGRVALAAILETFSC